MTKLRRMLAPILLAVVLVGSMSISGFAIPSNQGSGAHSHKSNHRPKTVHVRTYKKKNGTVVRAHRRAAPQPR